MLGWRLRCTRHELDKLENRAVRIVEACEQRITHRSVQHHRLRDEFHTLRLQFLISCAEVSGPERDARDAEMVQLWVGFPSARRTFPLDQIDSRRAGIVTDEQQRGASASFFESESVVEVHTAAFTQVDRDPEAKHLVEFERALEVRAIDVDVKNSPDHVVTSSSKSGCQQISHAAFDRMRGGRVNSQLCSPRFTADYVRLCVTEGALVVRDSSLRQPPFRMTKKGGALCPSF